MGKTQNEPYGFSISYKESVDNLYTLLTGRRLVPKRDEKGDPIPGVYDEIEIPNSHPILTPSGGAQVRAVLSMNMDKFNPIADLKDSDCAEAAATCERTLAAEITLNAPDYLYDYATHAGRSIVIWDAWLKNLTHSLYNFATLARDGHFINFAGKTMSMGYNDRPPVQEPGGLRRLFGRVGGGNKDSMTDVNAYR